MKRYFKTIRYMDLCLLWRFEVPVISRRILTPDTLLYIRVKKNGEFGRYESYAVVLEPNDECIGHFESRVKY